jgi:hypothetical protein
VFTPRLGSYISSYIVLDDLNFVQEEEVSECDIENFSRLWQTFQVTYIKRNTCDSGGNIHIKATHVGATKMTCVAFICVSLYRSVLSICYPAQYQNATSCLDHIAIDVNY